MPVSSSLAEALRESYVLKRELGGGEIPTVYLARDVKHDRYVPVRKYKPGQRKGWLSVRPSSLLADPFGELK